MTKSNNKNEQYLVNLQMLFDNMLNGFAFHEIVVDENNEPVDYIFLEVNKTFEKLTGIEKNMLIGNPVTKVLPGIESDHANWIGVYGKVALTGESIVFENYSAVLGKWYSISAYSPAHGYFATIFEDITERKKYEKELKKHKEQLEEIVAERTKELEKKNKELEEFNQLFIGREFRIKELKDKIENLQNQIFKNKN